MQLVRDDRCKLFEVCFKHLHACYEMTKNPIYTNDAISAKSEYVTDMFHVWLDVNENT